MSPRHRISDGRHHRRRQVPAALALVDAYWRGHTVEKEFTGGANSDSVRLVRLSDGTRAVCKRVRLARSENRSEVQDAYLAGLVARALGIERTTTAILGRNTTLTEWAPGVSGREERERAGDIDPAGARVGDGELRRHVQLRHGREIGLLDYVTGNLDRNDGNYLVDGDTVYPIDHGFASFGNGRAEDGRVRLDTPFAQHHLHATGEVHDNDPVPPMVPASELVSPFNTTELAEIRGRLQALEPEFTAQQASGKWQFLMQRFDTVDHAAAQGRHDSQDNSQADSVDTAAPEPEPGRADQATPAPVGAVAEEAAPDAVSAARTATARVRETLAVIDQQRDEDEVRARRAARWHADDTRDSDAAESGTDEPAARDEVLSV